MIFLTSSLYLEEADGFCVTRDLPARRLRCLGMIVVFKDSFVFFGTVTLDMDSSVASALSSCSRTWKRVNTQTQHSKDQKIQTCSVSSFVSARARPIA